MFDDSKHSRDSWLFTCTNLQNFIRKNSCFCLRQTAPKHKLFRKLLPHTMGWLGNTSRELLFKHFSYTAVTSFFFARCFLFCHTLEHVSIYLLAYTYLNYMCRGGRRDRQFIAEEQSFALIYWRFQMSCHWQGYLYNQKRSREAEKGQPNYSWQ